MDMTPYAKIKKGQSELSGVHSKKIVPGYLAAFHGPVLNRYVGESALI